jgi:hypothetical protein
MSSAFGVIVFIGTGRYQMRHIIEGRSKNAWIMSSCRHIIWRQKEEGPLVLLKLSHAKFEALFFVRVRVGRIRHKSVVLMRDLLVDYFYVAEISLSMDYFLESKLLK